MDSDSAHPSQLGIIEDGWWDSPHGHPRLYRDLPPSSQWICRLQQDPKSDESFVGVQMNNITHLFSREYLPLFMLLEIHQLCSLAVSQKWPVTSEQHTNALKNVHFVDCLRKHLLKRSEMTETVGRPVDQLLKRLIIRIMKGTPHVQFHRDKIRESPAILYEEYNDDVHWRAGETLLELLNIHSLHTYSYFTQHSINGPWPIKRLSTSELIAYSAP